MVRRGSYKSLFLLTSGRFPLEEKGNSVLNFGLLKAAYGLSLVWFAGVTPDLFCCIEALSFGNICALEKLMCGLRHGALP